jgi:hypothetical protein
MASLGKKILSAFVEVSDDDKKPDTVKQTDLPTNNSTAATRSATVATSSKFREYFDKLFNEANIPGPDYYEFSKMTEAMRSIPDESARFSAAFAGLSVQGLDKQKLLSTAQQYVQVLETDAANFHSTVDAALKEKVLGKKQATEEKSKRIQQLTQEISDLQKEIATLQAEIKENEEKIEANTGGYHLESDAMKNRILADIEKIKQYIH